MARPLSKGLCGSSERTSTGLIGTKTGCGARRVGGQTSLSPIDVVLLTCLVAVGEPTPYFNLPIMDLAISTAWSAGVFVFPNSTLSAASTAAYFSNQSVSRSAVTMSNASAREW